MARFHDAGVAWFGVRDGAGDVARSSRIGEPLLRGRRDWSTIGRSAKNRCSDFSLGTTLSGNGLAIGLF